MSTHNRFSLAITVLALALAGCGDDDGVVDGNDDKTPPALTSITPVDASHIDVVFSESVQRSSAERLDNYVILEGTTLYESVTGSPGDTLHILGASLKSDQKTVALTTESPMSVVPYEFSVKGVTDLAGNSILSPLTRTFTGSNAADTTPPELVYRSPGPNATNVAVGMPIGLQFSEVVPYGSFVSGFSWTSNGGPVAFDVETLDEGIHVTVRQQEPLAYATIYTVTLDGIQDLSGNTMPATSWSFTTSSNADHTPPTVVSSNPAPDATNVNVNADLSITFSEPMDPAYVEIMVMPDIGDGLVTWINSGKTLVFNPDLPLTDNQQYVVTILPGGVKDLAGNEIADIVFIRFTTGSALETGSFAGTLSGDPQSNYADDPTGAFVVAATAPPFETDDFSIGGFDEVALNNTYDIGNLADDVYYPFAIIDSNNDDMLDPSSGDAVGMYGIDVRGGDLTYDSLTIAGGNRFEGVDFPLYDASAITGTVSYNGAYSSGFYDVGVGLFDANNFDPEGPRLLETQAYWPNYAAWSFHSMDGLDDYTYYLGAFLDVNGSGEFEINTDPSGLYGGITPTPLVVDGGRDFLNLVIVLQDPPTQTAAGLATVKLPVEKASRFPALTRPSKGGQKVQGWKK